MTTPSLSLRPTHSCNRCAARKVKCDRQNPCSACINHNVDCVFTPPPPPGKRHKRPKDKNQILVDRLKHYEALLQEHGIDPDKVPDTRKLPDTPESESSRNISTTQVILGQGRSKIVDNSLWSRVVEEFHDPEDALDSSDEASDSETSDDNSSFVLGSGLRTRTRPYHPPSERILQMWEIFKERIDPMTKIVHVPSLHSAIQKAATNTEDIPRSFEALMFAIYSTAVMSLKDDECKRQLGGSRKTLLARYISATKLALSRAKFIGTISLVVLQALILHLVSVRNIYEPRIVWSMTGVAVRIGQSMGLERDGISLNLPPFEAELRRRIWWLLKNHDFRIAELCGLPRYRDFDIGADATKGPTNINDDQLYPGMSSMPAETSTMTDALLIVVRQEFSRFAAGRIAKLRQEGNKSNLFGPRLIQRAEMDEAFRELEKMLEMKYLRYCDPSQPLHLMTMLFARSAICNLRLLGHHPRSWASLEQTPLAERMLVWECSFKQLEQYNMLQSNPLLKQFAWLAGYVLQWHALIHVLDTLRAEPHMEQAKEAWELIESIYEHSPDMIIDMRKPIHVAVGNLCLKAYGARDVALQKGSNPLPTPEFILQLRHRRDLRQAQRATRDLKVNQYDQQDYHGQGMAPLPNANPDCSTNTLLFPHSQSTTPQGPDPTIPHGTTEGDLFWLNNDFDSQAAMFSDMMNVDQEFMLAEDHDVEREGRGDEGQGIMWEQWDAWLADSNLRPLQ